MFAKKEIEEYCPEKPGVYYLYNRDRWGNLCLTYIGTTKNLKNRFSQHQTSIPFSHVLFEVMENKKARMRHEKEMIRRFRPRFNTTDNPDRDDVVMTFPEDSTMTMRKNIAEKIGFSFNPHENRPFSPKELSLIYEYLRMPQEVL